jgi:hypothetical protein
MSPFSGIVAPECLNHHTEEVAVDYESFDLKTFIESLDLTGGLMRIVRVDVIEEKLAVLAHAEPAYAEEGPAYQLDNAQAPHSLLPRFAELVPHWRN